MTVGRGHRIFLFVIVMAAIEAPFSFAAPRLKIEPPPQKVAVEQSVFLTLRLEWSDSEGPYEINGIEPKLENLELEDLNQSQETGPVVSQTLRYKFLARKTGNALIDPFEIRYRKTGTDLLVPMLIPEYKIKIVSNFPVRILLMGLSAVGGLALVLVLGFKQWELWKFREAARKAPKLDPKQRIYKEAESAITNFSASDPKEKLASWSNQLRAVVITYYGITSRTATPEEILAFLKIQGLPAGEWNEISRIFQQLTELQFSHLDISACDLARMERNLLQYAAGKIIIGNPNS